MKKDFNPTDFKIEDNVFVFSGSIVDVIVPFLNDILEKNINKKIEEINKNDVKKITDIILTLKTSEILYSMVALLENYRLSETNDNVAAIEKIIAKKVFDKYRDVIYALADNDSNDSTTIENFEKEYNIEIIIE